AALAMAGAMVVAGACGSPTSPTKVTIDFATQGLGFEGAATKKAVDEFNKANPTIQVAIQALSPQPDVAYQQLTQGFVAGSPTPDVIASDVTWTATFAEAGWIQPVNRFNPNRSDFFGGQMQGGTYKGKLYAVPWFIDAEGLYYRTDLVTSPPRTPQQIVQDAQGALLQGDPSLKMGLAFTGARYEGVVTSFVGFA